MSDDTVAFNDLFCKKDYSRLKKRIEKAKYGITRMGGSIFLL